MTDRSYVQKNNPPIDANQSPSLSINESKRKKPMVSYDKPVNSNGGKSMNTNLANNSNCPKVKTITLGGRGCETARDRKSVKMAINWE